MEYRGGFDVGTGDAGAATTRNEVDVAGDRALSSESLLSVLVRPTAIFISNTYWILVAPGTFEVLEHLPACTS